MSKFMPFDWRCPDCDHKFEEWVKPSVQTVPCPECGGSSSRLISKPRFDPRMGVDPDFTTFADKWADVRRKRRKMEDRHFKEHGTNLAPGSSVKESSIQPLSMDTLRAANPTTIGPGKQD